MGVRIFDIKKDITGEIIYGVADTVLGTACIAVWDGKVIALKFADGEVPGFADDLKRAYKNVRLSENNSFAKELLDNILSAGDKAVFDVAVCGSPFKLEVYRALAGVPYGTKVTYSWLAAAAGHPKAIRAAASAIARNEAAVLIPCHRVVRTDGGLGGYRWGIERKEALLAAECKKR